MAYNPDQISIRHRFLQALAPSALSLLVCLSLGVGVIVAYLILISVSLGTSLPALFDGEWGVEYTNNVVRPILAFFSNLTLGNIMVIVLWGLAGFAVYLIVEMITHVHKSWRETTQNVQITYTGLAPHPGLRSFLVAAAWRLGVTIVFVTIAFFGLQAILHQMGSIAPKAVLGSLPTGTTIRHLAILAAELAAANHVCVVFLRLVTMRVRLFGNSAAA